MTQADEDATGEPSEPRHPDKPWYLQTRNVIGMVLAVVLIGVVGFGVRQARKPDLIVDCSQLRTDELTKSQDFLIGDLQTQVDRLEAEIGRAEQEEFAAIEVEAEVRSQVEADPDPSKELNQRLSDATTQLGVATATRDALVAQLEQKTAALDYARSVDPTDPAAVERTWTAPRSTVSFDADVAVAKIHFGSTRNAKRVEIRLTPQNEVADGAMAGEVAAEQATAPLPDTFWFVADTDQLRRNSGLEIPAEQVTTWARRFGDQVFLNVCIDPNSSLDAGRYVGSVHIVDSTMRQVTVPVEVTAQSALINWILLMLLFGPILAFLFVWIKLRHTANEDSSILSHDDKGMSLAPPFKKWIQSNFILSFVVGLAAVWAGLQVSLSNETFGDSLVKAAAAVVITLIAAVGAITPVVGKVRGDEIDAASPSAEDQTDG
jgi:hypothetical protein